MHKKCSLGIILALLISFTHSTLAFSASTKREFTDSKVSAVIAELTEFCSRLEAKGYESSTLRNYIDCETVRVHEERLSKRVAGTGEQDNANEFSSSFAWFFRPAPIFFTLGAAVIVFGSRYLDKGMRTMRANYLGYDSTDMLVD